METFGNIGALKRVIEKKYSTKIKEVEKEKEKQLAEINKELNKKLELFKANMETKRDIAVKKMHSMVLSKEKMKIKKEFEEQRESLINHVFKEAEKKAKNNVHNKDYIDYVKKNLPKEKKFVVIGDSNYYEKHFPKLKIDKNIIGLKFESEGVIYDFSLSNIIASKKDILRQEISKILFD